MVKAFFSACILAMGAGLGLASGEVSMANCDDVFAGCANECACLFPLYDQVPRRQGGSNAWGIRFRFSSAGLTDGKNPDYVSDDGWTYDWTEGQNVHYVTLTGIKEKKDEKKDFKIKKDLRRLSDATQSLGGGGRRLTTTAVDPLCQDFGETVPTGIIHASRNGDANGKNCIGSYFQINFLDVFTGQPEPVRCDDNRNFRDIEGYSCQDWLGKSCLNQNYKVVREQKEELLYNCRATCGACTNKIPGFQDNWKGDKPYIDPSKYYKITLYDASDPGNLIILENHEASPTFSNDEKKAYGCRKWNQNLHEAPPRNDKYCHENTIEPCLWCDPANDLDDITRKRATKAFYVFNLKEYIKAGVTDFAYSIRGVCGNDFHYKGVKDFFSCAAPEPTTSPTPLPTSAPSLSDPWVGDNARFVLGHAVADGATGYEESCVAPNLGKGFTYELTWVVAPDKFDSMYGASGSGSNATFVSTATNNDFLISVSFLSQRNSPVGDKKMVNVYAAFASRIPKESYTEGEELVFNYTTPVVCERGNTEPTMKPSPAPSSKPTFYPSSIPTAYPTLIPTAYPTAYPTSIPTAYPTAFPTMIPTAYPTAVPTYNPTAYPTAFPSAYPTGIPTAYPSATPTI